MKTIPSECIETTYWRDHQGYGRCGARRFGRRIQKAHILAWVDANGMLPTAERPCILHRCDNPPCINPEHLYAGTRLDNARDRKERGSYAGYGRDRTHCKHGHEFTPENTRIETSGSRKCRTCVNARAMRRYYAHKAAS